MSLSVIADAPTFFALEHGYFSDFCGAVWPVAFASGDHGLPAALRKYQDLKKPVKGYDFNEIPRTIAPPAPGMGDFRRPGG